MKPHKLCWVAAFIFMLIATGAAATTPVYSMVLQCIGLDFFIFGWLIKKK